MITLHKPLPSILLISSLALAGQAFAQMDSGFLGKRYAGAGLFLESVKGSDVDTGTGFSGTANLPLNEFLDLSGSASYERFDELDLRDKRLGALFVAYRDLDYFKPFVEAGIAGTWQSATVGNRTFKRHDGLYVVGVGVEAVVSRSSALFLKADFNKYFDSANGDYWTYTAGINSWFNERVGCVASIAFNEGESTVVSFSVVLRY